MPLLANAAAWVLRSRRLVLEHRPGSRRPTPATARVLEQTLGEPVTATNTALPLVELRLDS